MPMPGGTAALLSSSWDASSDAVASYDKAIARAPDRAETWNDRGTALYGLGRFDEALASYDKAIALKPDYAAAHANRGAALQDLQRFEEALAGYDKAIGHQRRIMPMPTTTAAMPSRPSSVFDEALASYDKAIALKCGFCRRPQQSRPCRLQQLGRLQEALASCDKAIALKPDDAESHNNRGTVLYDLGRLEDALASYDKAIELAPDHGQAHFNKSFAELHRGKLRSGWQNHEWRKRKKDPAGNRAYQKQAAGSQRRRGVGQVGSGARGTGAWRHHTILLLRPIAGPGRRQRAVRAAKVPETPDGLARRSGSKSSSWTTGLWCSTIIVR